MRSLFLLPVLVAALAAVVGAGCSTRNEDLNRVVNPYWSKAYFNNEDEWYLRSTVVDAPPEHGWISIADGDWLMLEKIRWEVTENALIGWRTYASAPGAENEDLPGADAIYRGQPVAVFAITDHFDIRRDFSTLSGEHSHAVLIPLTGCGTQTSEEAIAPSLVDLKDPFVARLQRAEKEAVETLDRLLVASGKETQLTQLVDLGLHNRELNTEEDVRALAREIESRLLPLVQQGGRVRIL